MTTDLTVVEQTAPVTLFGTDDPSAIVASASKKATALAGVIRDKGLSSRIENKEYVRVEGWTLLGTMLGVFPVCTWTRKLDDGWEARVEARTLADQLVGAAEAQCTRDEPNWKNRKEYALRSMAQTRATAKALRLPLGFVMSLAGYEATPMEEMQAEGGHEQHSGPIEGEVVSRSAPSPSGGQPASDAQKNAIFSIGRSLGWSDPETRSKVEEWATVPLDTLSKGRASACIEWLKGLQSAR